MKFLKCADKTTMGERPKISIFDQIASAAIDPDSKPDQDMNLYKEKRQEQIKPELRIEELIRKAVVQVPVSNSAHVTLILSGPLLKALHDCFYKFHFILRAAHPDFVDETLWRGYKMKLESLLGFPVKESKILLPEGKLEALVDRRGKTKIDALISSDKNAVWLTKQKEFLSLQIDSSQQELKKIA